MYYDLLSYPIGEGQWYKCGGSPPPVPKDDPPPQPPSAPEGEPEPEKAS